MFVWAVPPKWAFNYSDAVCSGTHNVSPSAWNHSCWRHSQHFHLIHCSLDWGAKAPFSPVAKIMNLLPENWISSYIQSYVTSTVIEFITFIYWLCQNSSTLCMSVLVFLCLFPFLFYRCPPGHMIRVNGTKKSCVYTLCATRPCHRGTCVAQSPSKFTCHCPEGYRGRHCETTLAVYREEVGLSFSSLFAICICFMALLGRLSTHCDTYRSFGTCDPYENTFTLLPVAGPGFTQFYSDQCKFWTFVRK